MKKTNIISEVIQTKHKLTLLIVFLINFSTWTGFSIFGPLVPEIAHSLSVGMGVLGVIHSICFIISGIMSFLWAYLESKYSRHSLLLSTLFLYSIGLLSLSFSFNYILFLILRIVMAVGFGAFLPLSTTIITDLKSPEHRTKALSLLGLTVIIGFGASNIIAGILLTITSWRMILFILGLTNMIITSFVYIMKLFPKEAGHGSNSYQYFHLDRTKIISLLGLKSNINFLILFFIHDFVIGSVSFYIIPMLKTELKLSPLQAMIYCIILYIPQLFGAPYWGKVADQQFAKKSNGKISLLLLIVIIGPLFSIIGYSAFSINLVIFVACIMLFAFITPTIPSIAYSILGDINPSELRITLFSLCNFCAICGRSIGIGICGILYDQYFHQYSIIFFIFQFVLLFGLLLTLLKPMHMISIEIRNLTLFSNQRVPTVDKTSKPTIKDILNTLIENQIKLFKNQHKLFQNQIYLTKFLKYSLEATRRILLLINKKDVDLENYKYINQLKHKLNHVFEVIKEPVD
ncbi:MAG: MFS transporter [Candidatus Hodarchaeota archaeon]